MSRRAAVAAAALLVGGLACGCGANGPSAEDCVEAWNAQAVDAYPRSEARERLPVGAGARLEATPAEGSGETGHPDWCTFVLVDEHAGQTWAYAFDLVDGRLANPGTGGPNPGNWVWEWEDDEPQVRMTADGGLDDT